MKRIPFHKAKPSHWLLIALLVFGALALETYISVTGILAGPAYLHRPVKTELAYYLAGGVYRVKLECPGRRKPRIHRLRADDYIEATTHLEQRFPDCRLQEIRRVRDRIGLLSTRRHRRWKLL